MDDSDGNITLKKRHEITFNKVKNLHRAGTLPWER